MTETSKNNKSTPNTIQEFGIWVVKIVLFFMVMVGGLSYVIHYISTLVPNPTTSTPSPLDLAATSGTIGALLLVGAFTKPENKLKRIGKLFLAAAVFFTITFLLLEWAAATNPPVLNFWQRLTTWVGAGSIVIGICSLADALVELVLLLPKL